MLLRYVWQLCGLSHGVVVLSSLATMVCMQQSMDFGRETLATLVKTLLESPFMNNRQLALRYTVALADGASRVRVALWTRPSHGMWVGRPQTQTVPM